MADTHAFDVVKYLRQKSSNGFDQAPIHLGAEQRFIGALRNSGINNLEEQYILGTETFTEKYYDENKNLVIERSYHINDDDHMAEGYYKLITVLYMQDDVQDPEYYYENDQIMFPNDENAVMIGDGSGRYLDRQSVLDLDKGIKPLGTGFNEVDNTNTTNYDVVDSDTEQLIFEGGSPYVELNEDNEYTIFGVEPDVFGVSEDMWLVRPTTYLPVRREELHYISDDGKKDLLVITKLTEKRFSGDGTRTMLRETVTNHLEEET